MTIDLKAIKASAQITADRCPEHLVTVPAGVMLEIIDQIESLHGSCRALGTRNVKRVMRENERLKSERESWISELKIRIDMQNQLIAEKESLRRLCIELRGSAECHNVHHCKAEQHGHDEPCKVLERIDAALAKEAK